MPMTREISGVKQKLDEPEKPAESDERVDYGGGNDAEDVTDEEVEYEEVEEEEEYEEVEEEEEIEEEEDDDDVGGEAVERVDINKVQGGKDNMTGIEAAEEVERKKHLELLALPPHGSEVYVGGFPHNITEGDLRRFCESVGEVTEVRIMKGKDLRDPKCYAFVTFRTKELGSKAIEKLNNSELKGRKVRCSESQAKHRLFIGNIPRNWEEEDIKKAVSAAGPGVISVQLVKDPQNSSRNRGFAFIEYHNHACAEYSRQKMSNPNFKLDDNAPTVSWADPKNADSSAISQVKSVYVKNLPKDITQDRLKALFEHHGEITKVVLPPAKPGKETSRFGFVHFAERSCAMKALKNTERYEIDGQVLDCSLAKPQADQRPSVTSNSHNSALLPGYPPHLGYGIGGGAYGALGAGYGAAGFSQPLLYGGGNTPAGMAMMPMLLPDGRIGYILQQPGTQFHTPTAQTRGSGRDSSAGSSGRRSNESRRGRGRYNPY